MCGIVGYIGEKQAKNILINALKRLEYRGYDSAGAAFLDDNEINIIKTQGKVAALEQRLDATEFFTGTGIGHTRWATHGAPSDTNAHPHLSSGGGIAVVHNGIIDNYQELKTFLLNEGYSFCSDTDTEVISNLLEYNYNNSKNMSEAIATANSQMEGAYALGILCAKEPGKLFAIKKQSPLVIGIGEEENFLASDFAAVVEHTRDFYLLEEGEFAVITQGEIEIFDEMRKPVSREIFSVSWDIKAAEKDGYPHFMFKEIMEQPKAIRNTIGQRISDGDVLLDDIKDLSFVKDVGRIHIVACGSSWHAGLAGKAVIEKLVRVPVEVHLASEFRYSDPILTKSDFCIAISQSGETADTLGALRHAKQSGVRTLGVVNVFASAIARESDDVLYTRVGPEIAVATTKGYSAQLAVLYLVGLKFANIRGLLAGEEYAKLISEVSAIPERIAAVLEQAPYVREIAQKFAAQDNVFLIGRGLDHAAVMEGSLKLKEISYVHSEAYAAGELKHGTISLIEDGTLVVAVSTAEKTSPKTLSNLQETRARGAKGLVITTRSLLDSHKNEIIGNDVIEIPNIHELFSASLTAIPLQLFAYYVAEKRGCDIDMPKHLAKSVTVE